jgi:TRAP-type C4-dicarboxylate transport system substrate-binding protein
MKRLYFVFSLVVIICLTLCLIVSCRTPEPTPTPTPAPAPAPAPSESIEEVQIRITTPIPAGDVLVTWCQEGFDRFNKRTNGEYNMKIYPGQQLAKMPESLDAVRIGAVEGGVIPPAAFAGTVPEFSLPELPFLYNNAEANAAAEACITEVFNEVLEAQCNQKSLGCFYVGTNNLLSSKPVKTLEDWKGLIVGCGNPSTSSLVTLLGGSPVVTSLTDAYSNLQKGIVDAGTYLPQFVLIGKLNEVAKNYTVFYGLGSVYSINLNLDVWEKMPQNIKDILADEMGQLTQELNEKHVSFFNDQLEALSGAGVDVYYLPKEERDKWMDLCLPQTNSALDEFGENGQRIKQCAEEANKKYPYNR